MSHNAVSQSSAWPSFRSAHLRTMLIRLRRSCRERSSLKRGLSLIAFANQRPSLVGCLLRSACFRGREGVQLRLSFPYGIFVSVAFLSEQTDVHGAHRRNHARLLQHVAVVGTSADRATEVLQRSHVG